MWCNVNRHRAGAVDVKSTQCKCIWPSAAVTILSALSALPLPCASNNALPVCGER